MIPQARTPAHEQDPKERARNFKEVNCGYLVEDAQLEAERCLMCPEQPCVQRLPGQHRRSRTSSRRSPSKDYRGAYDVITATNLLPAVCGRVCPQENQCEGVCTVGESLEPVAIGRLERWVGDLAIKEGWSNIPYIEPSGFRIGIVGSGPAGMACAADMAKAGCEVTVYEAFHEPGGVLKYGIPDFRLPNSVVDAEIEKLEQLGVRFECNTLVGRLFTIEQMVDEMGFHAVFIGTGAGYPSFMGIPGESLNGVLSANELLTRCNLMHARDFPNYDTPLQPGKRVAVIGAGNTAMDALRVCLRLGAEKVRCLYRRSRAEAPGARRGDPPRRGGGHRVPLAREPGRDPRRRRQRSVRAVRCVRMALGEPDASGRRRPVPEPGSEFEIEADMVVYAIGTNANPIIGQTSRLKLDKRGYIATDDEPRDVDSRRVRRRRHRHRRRHGDRGHGRRTPRRARHEGLPRPARHRLRLPGAAGRRRVHAVRHRPRRARVRARAHAEVIRMNAAVDSRIGRRGSDRGQAGRHARARPSSRS